jgi:predicted choloylglycine hydrolase
MKLVFEAVEEDQPGEKWAELFSRLWPAYRDWYLSQGVAARPTYAQSVAMLRRHMPELLPTYEVLCELAGGSDLAARFLSLYRPPAFLSGCSQAVWPGEEPALIRNYDYSPYLCDAVILHSRWGNRRVIAMTDCLWGCLDGINDAGLAVSLAFGGRRVVGDGFGIPIVQRYVLETCSTAEEAIAVLRRVPTHMAYNVTVVDRWGVFYTAELSPDRPAVVRRSAVATNHQGAVEWHHHARATATVERERHLSLRLADDTLTPDALVQLFLQPPLYATAHGRGFGTLYTAVYRPLRGDVEYRWPNVSWCQSFADFREGVREVRFTPQPAEAGSP